MAGALRKIAAGISKLLTPSAMGARVTGSNGWFPIIRDWEPGAWQRNEEWTVDTVLAHHAVYACITLIANDIGKLRPRITRNQDGIWVEDDGRSPFWTVLKRPNRFQNHIQFKQWWITSKLIRGNFYGLKVRDARGVVEKIYPLDPDRVQVLVAPDGSIFYKIAGDNLAGIPEGDDGLTVPANEIIHDRMNCLFHPLVGVSPLFANGQVANLGLNIEQNSSRFFGNSSMPGGLLVAPGAIDEVNAARLKEYWNNNFTGANAGKVAVVGDGLEFRQLRMSAEDSQLIEQLQWTAQIVAATFHVPPYMVGIGPMPTYNNIEALSQKYYTQCLQSLIEEMELCLDEGLGLANGVAVGLDLDSLLRMDTSTLIKTLGEGIQGAIYTPNEARKKLNLPPKKGGDSPYLQQQQYSLEALAKRDAQTDPFNPGTPPLPSAEEEPVEDPEEATRAFLAAIAKGLDHA